MAARKAEEGPDAAIAKALKQRLRRADIDRNRHKRRIEDCYRYALPWRHKFDATQPVDQLDDIFDDILMTTVEDFAADMLNTFTPAKNPWVSIEPAATLDTAALRQLQAPLKEYQAKLFAEMLRSNLYQALQESYLDLGTGTMALMIQDRHPSQPILCQAVPLTELLLDRGPWGETDGRWRKFRARAQDIMTLWPKARPPAGEPMWRKEDEQELEVVDGLYRDWSDIGTETWIYAVMVSGKIVLRETFKGSGSNPMIVARWSRDSTTAWGVGPTYRSMPSFKALNHIRFTGMKNLDKFVDPPVSYEDDSVINLDHGVEPGVWIPRAVGSQAPEPIESKGEFNLEFANIEDLRSSIKRAHYQDRPEQTGKTPPTATQWADEAAERARRMGTPATNLVIDLQYPIVARFAYLLERRGVLPKIKLNDEVVALTPVSPLLRAQEQEEVVRADRWLEMLTIRFGPEMANAIVKQLEYAAWLADKMGVEPKLIRTEQELAQAIQQFAPILGGGGEAPAEAAAAA